MSAYRRINRTSRSITFQHPNLSAYQQHHHSNGVDNLKTSTFKNGFSDYSSELWGNNVSDMHQDQQSMQTNGQNHGNETSYPSQPKHLRFPDVPYNSELLNEFIIFAYTAVAAAMQFLHLYRTVWWLPDSNTSQTMVITCNIDIYWKSYNFSFFFFLSFQNFYLIDKYLTIFIAVLLSRRVIYGFLRKILELMCPSSVYKSAVEIMR